MISRNNLFVGSCGIAAFLVFAAPLLFIAFTMNYGFGQIDIQFLLSSPSRAGREGGIFPILISTLYVVFIAVATAIPVGLLAALSVYKFQQHGRAWIKYVLSVLDVIYSIPSVVFGLVGYALFVSAFGLGYSVLAGGLSVGMMLLPLFIKIAVDAFGAVPNQYILASHSLNVRFVGFIRKILLPMAFPGLVTAFILSCGRVISETAVLLFTAGYVMRMPESIFDSGRTLSVHIFELALNVPGGMPNAAATACVLMLVVVIFNLLARMTARVFHRRVGVT